jgi:tetratricopeptide (TPR) repeat protein
MMKQIFTYCIFISFIISFIFAQKAFSSDIADPLKHGIFNLKEENYEEAIDDLKKYREQNPTFSIAAYFLGIAYKKTYNFAEAKIHFKDAVTFEPRVKEAVVELSDTLYQLGEFEDALKELEIAEGLGIQPAQVSFLKGLVLTQLGRKSEAVMEDHTVTYKDMEYPYTKNKESLCCKGSILPVSKSPRASYELRCPESYHCHCP